MSDSDKSLEILIKTKADLAGAKEAEAQLEQDIAKAKALGEAYEALETRLKSVRKAIVESQGNDEGLNGRSPSTLTFSRSPSDTSPLTPLPSERRGEPEARQGNDAEAMRENGLLGWAKAGVDALRLAFEAIPKFFGTARSSIAASAERQDNLSRQDKPQQAAEKTGNIAMPGLNPTIEPLPSFSGGVEKPSPPAPLPSDGRGWRQAPGQEENDIAGQSAESHSQAIQFSGERIRAALEQNTQITVSLFNRTLELIDQQNRKLGEVDRRIAELGGQIKSLKNL